MIYWAEVFSHFAGQAIPPHNITRWHKKIVETTSISVEVPKSNGTYWFILQRACLTCEEEMVKGKKQVMGKLDSVVEKGAGGPRVEISFSTQLPSGQPVHGGRQDHPIIVCPKVFRSYR